MSEMQAGRWQTVTRCQHPNRGEGIAVYKNGPSFFQPNDGPAIPMPIGDGGWSSTEGSWICLGDPEHGGVKAKVLKAGEVHRREWHPMLGMGWWTMGGRLSKERFESDSETIIEFQAVSFHIGTPNYVKRDEKKARGRNSYKAIPMTTEEEQWVTIITRHGEVVALRDSAPEAGPTETGQG